MKIKITSLPVHAEACELCPLGAGRFYARHYYHEEGALGARREANMCDICLTEELASWPQTAPVAPEPTPTPPAVPVQQVTTIGWPMSYASALAAAARRVVG